MQPPATTASSLHLQEKPLAPLNVYAQQHVDNIAANQARLAASGLGATRNVLEEATQPAPNKGKRRRADQEHIPQVLCSCGCGANTCCAQSQHKWLPPTLTTLQSMQSHAEL